MSSHRFLCSMALASLAFAAPVLAKSTKHGQSAAGAHGFVREAAMGGMAEVELGQLAQERAASDSVKAFGQRMVDDHSKANDELKDLAASKQIDLPAKPDAKHKAVQDRLSKLSGKQFDRAYMQAMTDDHVHDVAAFKREAQSSKDPDVKAFASKTLPTLEDHLAEAKRVRAGIESGGRGTSHHRTNTSMR